MSNRIAISIVVMILGLLIITVPIYILPVCPPTETITHTVDGHTHTLYKFMKCHWTAQAELGTGAVVAALGLLMFFIKSHLIRLGISLSLTIIAILAAAIPSVLIGVCPNEMMICNMGTLPALVIISGLLFVVAAINAAYLKKQSKPV